MSIEERKGKAILSVNSCFFCLPLGHFDTKAPMKTGCGQLTEGKRFAYNAGINQLFQGGGYRMANIVDYIAWRGDIPLTQVPLGEVDSLILAYLSYMPFDGIVPPGVTGTRTRLSEAALALVERHRCEGIQLAYTIGDSNEADCALLEALSKSVRFADIGLFGYVDHYDREGQEQFSAVAFELPDGSVYIGFRGTDSTVVGWKENFNMSFEDEVPAQRDAVAYTEAVYDALKRPLYLGGHSKGGNLAVYAGMFVREDVRSAIVQAYSFDGPGFNELIAASPEFTSLDGRVHTYVPQSSLVGILMWHSEPFTIIRSDSVSVFQHDVYTWQLMGGSFLKVEERTDASRFADRALKTWLADLSPEQKESFVNGIYTVISAGKGKNLDNLLEGRSLLAMLKALGTLDDKTRSDVQDAIRSLGDAFRETAAELIERNTQDLA